MSSSLSLWLRNGDWPDSLWSEALLRAPLGEVIAALDGPAEPDELAALSNFLRQRCDERSADALVNLLRHSDPSVRSEAEQALSSIRDPRTGPAIAAALERETDPDVLSGLALTAGSVGATGAAAILIALLKSEFPTVRGAAAASLGVLDAVAAAYPIAQAYRRELDAWALRRMDEALMRLEAAEDASLWGGFVVFDFAERDRHIRLPHWNITTSRGTTEYRALNGDRIGMARPDVGGRLTPRPDVLDLSPAGIIAEIRTATINAHRVVTCLHYLAPVESLLAAIAMSDEPAILEILLLGVS